VEGMTDFCLICETEPIEKNGWFTNDEGDSICPWCIKEVDWNHQRIIQLENRIKKLGYSI
jgi:hypothetical protein